MGLMTFRTPHHQNQMMSKVIILFYNIIFVFVSLQVIIPCNYNKTKTIIKVFFLLVQCSRMRFMVRYREGWMRTLAVTI